MSVSWGAISFFLMPADTSLVPIDSVKAAHDELLRNKPEGAVHKDCPICESGHPERAEEATMADPIFTQEQHVELLKAAVERETASLTATKEELTAQVASLSTEKAEVEAAQVELQNKIDVLESEKAAESARADAAEKAFEDFKNEIAEKAAIEERKAERLAAVKAADGNLTDEYFTEARVQRWAEMSDDSFASLVEDLTEAAAKKTVTAPEADGADKAGAEKAARETAAFKGGEAPTAVATSGVRALFEATGKLPAGR